MEIDDGSPPRASRRRRRASLAAALVLAPVIGVGLTSAAWTDREFATAGLNIGTVRPPGTLTCSGGGSFVFGNTPPTVNFSWAAPAAPANSLAISGYSWQLTQGATVVTSGTTAAAVRTAAITGGAVGPAGNYTFTVTTTGPSGWSSVAGPTGTYAKTAAILGFLLGSSGCSVP